MNLNLDTNELIKKTEPRWIRMRIWSEVAINLDTNEWRYIRGWQQPIDAQKTKPKTKKIIKEDYATNEEEEIL